MSETVITYGGLARLREELERLTTDGRRMVADRLRHALSTQANASENADYLAAREEQALLEHRIALLQERLGSARPVEPQPGNGLVDVGERVRVRDLDSGERLDLELVGPLETDVAAGRISLASPLGRAIVGRRRGEVVEVDAPRGPIRYRILAAS
jgi:transcription elongation factor GreA